jgi:four helix bundle protein
VGVKRFEDLQVWQAARELARRVYRASETQKLASDWALANQMKRAVVSIGSNIAEGFEKGTRKQQIEACYTPKGSAGELRSQIITARDVGLIDKRAFEWLHGRCESCSRQLQAYIAHLRRTRSTLRGPKYLDVAANGE